MGSQAIDTDSSERKDNQLNTMHQCNDPDNRTKGTSSQMGYPVPVCYGACTCFNRRSLEEALDEMRKKWDTRPNNSSNERSSSESLLSQLRKICDQIIAMIGQGETTGAK